jgi:hypothetical protein
MRMLRSGLSLFVLVHFALTASGQSRVLVVSHSSGPFFDIQSAVDAASDRDTVLVKSGAYPGFSIDDKRLNVIADTNAAVLVTSLVQVRNLRPGRDVVLVGLTVAPPGTAGADALDIEDDRGSVRVESCDLNGFHAAAGGRGAVIANADDVAFTFSHITSGAADQTNHVGCAGLLAFHSKVALYDAESHGGDGSYGCPSGFTGGAGIDLQSTFLFTSRCRSYGGNGGNGSSGGLGCGCGADGGSGGSGLRLVGGSVATLLAGRFVGGAGGQRDCGDCGGCGGVDGTPGASIQGAGATVITQPGRMLQVPNPVREVASFPVTVAGRSGDQVYLFVSRETAFRYSPGYQGVSFTQQPLPRIFLGTIGASGTLSTTLSFPDLGPGIDSRNNYLQAAVLDATGSWILSDLSSLVVLDRAF